MDPNSLTQNPFAALTFVAAPPLLTNASSVLALGTINRWVNRKLKSFNTLLATLYAGLTIAIIGYH
jgi:hypothetical protein